MFAGFELLVPCEIQPRKLVVQSREIAHLLAMVMQLFEKRNLFFIVARLDKRLRVERLCQAVGMNRVNAHGLVEIINL